MVTLSRLFPGRLMAGVGHGVLDCGVGGGLRPEPVQPLLRQGHRLAGG